jgi:hypothetical protein
MLEGMIVESAVDQEVPPMPGGKQVRFSIGRGIKKN